MKLPMENKFLPYIFLRRRNETYFSEQVQTPLLKNLVGIESKPMRFVKSDGFKSRKKENRLKTKKEEV